ncbi:MAG TPA: hypothetical protein GXZ82_08755 [Firmicutes bacterium]|nr:hypothetical protein [Bacillota bacterium]
MGYIWIPTQASWTIDMVGRLPAKAHQWRTVWHENPFYQWNVATGPNMRLQVGNERIILNKGDCLLLRPYTRHTGWGPVEDGTGFYFVRFMTDPCPIYQKISLLSQRAEPGYADQYLVLPELGQLNDYDAVLATFAEIVHAWLEQRPFYQMYISTLLQRMLLTAVRSGIMPLDDAGNLRLESPRRMEVLKQVLEYIDRP